MAAAVSASVKIGSISPSMDSSVIIKAVDIDGFRIEGVGDLRALAAFGEDVAWVGGAGGKIAKTEDGGRSWSVCSLPDGDKLYVRALYLSSSNIACAMCSGPAEKGLSRIYRTMDGGTHWDLVLAPQTQGVFFNAMVFFNSNEGILLSDPVDNEFVIYKTENAGETWEKISPLEMPPALNGETAFAASNSCLAVQGTSNIWFATGGSACGRVFYSTDKGIHWGVATTPIQVNSPSSGIFSLAFYNDKMGIAVGGDHQAKTSFPYPNIIVTEDGGINWHPMYDRALAQKYLSSVAWAKEKKVMVVDCSLNKFNSLVLTKKGGWAVGPNQMCGKFNF